MQASHENCVNIRQEVEILQLNGQIQTLKGDFDRKCHDLEQKEALMVHLKAKQEQVLVEKESTIETLNKQLVDRDQRLNQMMRESLTGSTSAAVQRLQEELTKNEHALGKAKSDLDEQVTKYKALKQKVKAYQIHSKEKEERYKQYLKESDDDYREKLELLKKKTIEAYNAKQKEVKYFLLCTFLVFQNLVLKQFIFFYSMKKRS